MVAYILLSPARFIDIAQIIYPETMSEEAKNTHSGTEPDISDTIGEPEPWAGWETRLCLWSVALGIGGLVLLAVLLHGFLL